MTVFNHTVIKVQKALHLPERKKYREDFAENLREQARALHKPVGLIAMLAWINFAFRIDPVLHPEFPGLFYFRLGLILAGGYVFVASFFERLRGRGPGLIYLLVVFAFFSCSFFTGRIADDAAYVSGLQILILLLVAAPVPFRVLVTWYAISIALFVSAVLIYQPAIGTMAARYSLNNLVIAYVLGLTLGFFVDIFRFNMFLNQTRLNDALAELRFLVAEVAEKSDIVTASSASLLSLSRKMNDIIESIADKMKTISSEVTGAVRQMNENMEQMGEVIRQSSINVGLAETATREMMATIQQMAENSKNVRGRIDQAVPLVSRASDSVRNLDQAAAAIGSVADAISGISGQTNLLSLNATIEAARAGDAGKGFAIVAAEVKELAGQAGQATQDINEQIGQIQATTTATVEVIEKVAGDIENIHEIAAANAAAIDSQLGAADKVADNVQQASAGIQAATDSIDNTATVSSGVKDIVADLDTVCEEILAIGTQVRTSAEALSGLADQLNRTLADFETREDPAERAN